MIKSLSDWRRPHYQEPGGKPFLFFVVYGRFENEPSFSRNEYRSDGVPTGFDLFHYDSEKHPDVLNGFREGYLWDEFQTHNPALSTQVAESKECMLLRGEIEDSTMLNYLRDSVGLLTSFLDQGGITIYDPFMFQWWEPENWRIRIFNPGEPVPRHHVVILTSEEEDPTLTWFHTRGMRKFGRPDLSIHNVGPEYHVAIIDLCNRFIEFLALGGVITEGQVIRMRSLPGGMICHLQGDLEDPDFNNVHVEITWHDK